MTQNYAKVAKDLIFYWVFKMKKICSLLAVLFLTACGFEPLYVQKKHDNLWYFNGEFDRSIYSEMAKIKVQTIPERFGQQLRNNLLDMLTPLGVPARPEYRLFVDVAPLEVTQQAMRDDITATRERIRYKVSYRLLSAQDNQVLVTGDSLAYVSYDIMANPYSTTFAKKKTEKSAASIIANDIALRLGAYFHSHFSKGNNL